jgi:hypothetical protein
VEHLASHRLLADEGAGLIWKKANLSGTTNFTDVIHPSSCKVGVLGRCGAS